jgi:hypothetical protein
MIEFDEDTDEECSWYDGQCYACDLYGRVDDLGLCEECRTKLGRDLIRQQDWDYSAWAFGLSDEDREKLYGQVIAQYGKKLELIAPPEGTGKQRPARRRRRKGGAQNRSQST